MEYQWELRGSGGVPLRGCFAMDAAQSINF
jgi:hypothetical protein